MSCSRRALLAAALAAALAAPAFAHRTGEGYIYIVADDNGLSGRVEATIEDLSKAISMDDDGDGEVSREEFDTHFAQVESYVLERVAVGTEGADYPMQLVSYELLDVGFGTFAQMAFVTDGPDSPPEVVEAEYRLLYDAIPEHRGLLLIEHNVRTGQTQNESVWSAVFTPDEPRHSVDLNEPVIAHGFRSYLKHGVHHILIGTDHVLFILALLMVSVLRREGPGWAPVERFLPALINVAKVITLFTVAHSVTLSLAALGVIDLSPRIVESIIALSVLVAALNNIRPFFGDWTWSVIFGFGLFHGMGFASVLTHLIIEPALLVKSLLGFNVGVEIGQLAIIAVAFPVLFVFRKMTFYRKLLLPVGSAAIAIVAAVWFVERAFLG